MLRTLVTIALIAIIGTIANASDDVPEKRDSPSAGTDRHTVIMTRTITKADGEI